MYRDYTLICEIRLFLSEYLNSTEKNDFVIVQLSVLVVEENVVAKVMTSMCISYWGKLCRCCSVVGSDIKIRRQKYAYL